MIKFENTEVLGWEHAIRGMRNPMNSWEKSDSVFRGKFSYGLNEYVPVSIGPNDLNLMTRLRNAGTDHRKFMRMIVVYVDILAPLYWWKEFDTYKVGTVANSCSTMHKIAAKEFTLEDFSCEHLMDNAMADAFQQKSPLDILYATIDMLNLCRRKYLETKSKPMKNEQARKELMKKYWWQMIQLLPSSYNQRRTIMCNYEVLANIYKSRKGHRLDEWNQFCEWIEGLPYSELIIGLTESEKMARLYKKLQEGFEEGVKSVKVSDVEKIQEAFANTLGISKDELLSMPIEGLTPNTVRELMGMEPISHEVISDSTPLFLKKSMTIPEEWPSTTEERSKIFEELDKITDKE